MKRIAVCLVLAAGSLAAEQKLPPAMASALNRIAHGETAPIGLITPAADEVAAAPRPVCSVPLLEMKIENPERFAMPVVPAPKNVSMPQAAGPAPPCATNSARPATH